MMFKHFMTSLMLGGFILPALAAGNVETRAYYATNPDGVVGKSATITIDGNASDWSDDMIIATCGANDMGTTFKGSHENCVIDLYAIYGAWDDSNLYLAWQCVNTGDTWAREGDGPLTDGGRIGDVPFVVALSIDPSKPGMTGKLSDGGFIWGDAVSFDRTALHVDHLLYMSAKPGLGSPGLFTTSSADGTSNYGADCKVFSTVGITYAMMEGFAPSHLWRQRTCAEWADATTLISDPSIVNNIYDPDCYDNLMAGPVEGLKSHDTKFDSFYEMKIPLSALGITRQWLEANGIGVRVIGTRGESAIDCCPFDPTVTDNIFEQYAKDPSTTGEKDDVDVFTYALADIAKVRDLQHIDPTPDPDPDPTPDPDPDPDPDPTPDPNPDDFVIYFDNSSALWSTVKVHYWGGESASEWPGADMTPVSGATQIYHYVVPEGTTGLVFHNGAGTQTRPDFTAVRGHIYDLTGDKGAYTAPVGTAGIVTDTDAPLYFNLQGMPVQTPTQGVYIVKRGATVTKVLF